MTKPRSILAKVAAVSIFAFVTSCSYTAPFRRVETVARDATVVVTLSQVEHQKGKRKPFFEDTRRVLADLPNNPGLVGYSFRFQIIGNKAWTITAWKDEAARDQFARSPVHLAAVRNSRLTAQNMRFISLQVPASSLPMSWDKALRHLEKAQAYD